MKTFEMNIIINRNTSKTKEISRNVTLNIMKNCSNYLFFQKDEHNTFNNKKQQSNQNYDQSSARASGAGIAAKHGG